MFGKVIPPIEIPAPMTPSANPLGMEIVPDESTWGMMEVPLKPAMPALLPPRSETAEMSVFLRRLHSTPTPKLFSAFTSMISPSR